MYEQQHNSFTPGCGCVSCTGRSISLTSPTKEWDMLLLCRTIKRLEREREAKNRLSSGAGESVKFFKFNDINPDQAIEELEEKWKTK